MPDVRAEVEAILIEIFRKALMVEHHHDWDMDTVSEAAHICARAWCDSFKSPALNDGTPDMTDEQLRSAVAHLASAIVILANRTVHEIGLDSAKAVAAECAAAVEALHHDGEPRG